MNCQKENIYLGWRNSGGSGVWAGMWIDKKEKPVRKRDQPEQRHQEKQEKAGFAEDGGGQVLENTFREIPQEERGKEQVG